VHDGTGDINTALVGHPIPFARRENGVIVVPHPTLLRITFQWPNGMSGWNTLTGTLTPNGTNIWHLDGTVVVTDASGTVRRHVWTWVPPVTGEFAQDASSEVLAADLVPALSFRPGQSLTSHSWISSQEPQPNSQVAVGSTVDMDVSNTIIP